jgi:hypothetical protein
MRSPDGVLESTAEVAEAASITAELLWVKTMAPIITLMENKRFILKKLAGGSDDVEF